MVTTQQLTSTSENKPQIAWEALPEDFQLEDDPVENNGQPLLAGALREILELAGFIQPQMLIVSNFGLCATLDGKIVVKAPDWLYVPSIISLDVGGMTKIRRSYTPNLQGEIPQVVMEFLSDTDGEEYSQKSTFPPGKWFFFEQILKVPIYVIFEPNAGRLEVYALEDGVYQPAQPNAEGRYWIGSMKLFLGTWWGYKEGHEWDWLRWWDESGNLLPWAVESIAQAQQLAAQAQQLAEQERQQSLQQQQIAEQAQQRAERLAELLRSQGIDPDNL